MIRAKFKVDSIESRQSSRWTKGPDGKDHTEQIEVRTVKLSPVYSEDPNSENRKFWLASPSGTIELGCANLEAAKAFELGREYYIDFSPVS